VGICRSQTPGELRWWLAAGLSRPLYSLFCSFYFVKEPSVVLACTPFFINRNKHSLCLFVQKKKEKQCRVGFIWMLTTQTRATSRWNCHPVQTDLWFVLLAAKITTTLTSDIDPTVECSNRENKNPIYRSLNFMFDCPKKNFMISIDPMICFCCKNHLNAHELIYFFSFPANAWTRIRS